MERIPVISSNLRSVGYDADMRLLEIEFMSGAIYRYRAVPQCVYSQLMGAVSVGKAFQTHVAGQYAFETVTKPY